MTEPEQHAAVRRLAEVEDELRRMSMAQTAFDPEALGRRDALDNEQAKLRAELGLPPIAVVGARGHSRANNSGWLILFGVIAVVVALLVLTSF